MYLMVDVVVNHNGFNGAGPSTDYSVYNPFNKEEYYHSYCEILNYNNQTNVEDCWLGDTTVALPDLRTEDPAVSQEYYSWINGLVSNYSIDGLRIDTVKHVDMDFWAGFNAAAGVYCTGEVLDTDASYVCPYQDNLDSLLNYPVYFPLISAFESNTGSMSALVTELNSVKSTCKDSTLLGSFR
jgi:alpha-amylase